MSIVSYIILHYKTLEDTIKCIESIKDLEKENNTVNIVVVDNASKDGSIQEIKSKNSYNNIYFIINDKNLGYAQGNNIGIKFAKENLKSDFVVVINSDTEIKDKSFTNSFIRLFEQEKFYILGPRVIGYYDGDNQSPISMDIDSSKVDVVIQLLKTSARWLVWKINIYNIFRKFITLKKKNSLKSSYCDTIQGKRYYKGILHGSCLIFSPLFLNNWNGFYSKTFLYREEAILFYILDRLNCKYMFTKEITIYHKSGISTNKVYRNMRKKYLFVYKYGFFSQLQQLKIMFLSDEKLKTLL